MKKFIIIFYLILATTMPTFALSVKVSSLQDFSTKNPSSTLKVVVLESVNFYDELILEEGTVLKGDIFDVKPPNRGKRDATFKFRPTCYSYNGKIVSINSNMWAKYAPYKKLDATGTALSVATFAGGQVLKVPFLGQAVSFVKGVVKNPDDNRIKSGATQIYKDSFVSYIEKGMEISLKKDEMFILKFESENSPQDANDSKNSIEQKTSSTLHLPENSTQPAIEQSRIHSVEPYEVLQEIEKKQTSNE